MCRLSTAAGKLRLVAAITRTSARMGCLPAQTINQSRLVRLVATWPASPTAFHQFHQEEGSTMGQLKPAFACTVGAGERTSFMAK